MGHNPVMRRFVILFWIYSLLASNLAWAIDIDEMALPDDATIHSVAGDDGAPAPDTSTGDHCDHCCHGSAHLTGILCVAIGIQPMPQPLPQHASGAPRPNDRVPPTPPPNI